jgi:cytochrome c oxidase subunit 1
MAHEMAHPRADLGTVSTVAELTPTRPFPPRRGVKGSFVYRVLTTTDPKLLGIMYTVTSVGFFMAGGLMALLMRSELGAPGLQFLSNEQYNQLFTMHGTIVLLLYATPIVFGFANCILPLQIGAPDVAFPRLNALSYWLYLFGALITVAGFLTRGAADFGWTPTPAQRRAAFARRRRRSVDHGPGHRRSGHHPGCGQR